MSKSPSSGCGTIEEPAAAWIDKDTLIVAKGGYAGEAASIQPETPNSPIEVDRGHIPACMREYNIIGRLGVDEVLSKVPANSAGQHALFKLDGVTHAVNVASNKLRTFKSSRVCARCGREGAYFLLGVHKRNPNRKVLEMFTEDGREMTRDHIVPKSRGGSNDLGNSQTMCGPCNVKKGSKMPG